LYSKRKPGAKPGAWDIATDYIFDVASRMKMAAQWLEFLLRVNAFIRDKRVEWKEAGGAGSTPGSTESEIGGGLEHWGDFERAQKDVGTLTTIRSIIGPVKREDLNIEHDLESEERSAASSPVFVGKVEPSPSFTPVNLSKSQDKPTDMISPSPKPSLPGTDSIFVRGAYDEPYSTQNHNPGLLPSTEQVGSSSAYYQNPHPRGPTLQPLYSSLEAQQASMLTTAPSYGTYLSHNYPSQHIPLNPTTINNLENSGTTSIGNGDLYFIQSAETHIGGNDVYLQHTLADSCWFDMPSSDVRLSNWDGTRFETHPDPNAV